MRELNRAPFQFAFKTSSSPSRASIDDRYVPICLNNDAHDSGTLFGSFLYSSSIASKYAALEAFKKSSLISRFGVGFGGATLALAFDRANTASAIFSRVARSPRTRAHADAGTIRRGEFANDINPRRHGAIGARVVAVRAAHAARARSNARATLGDASARMTRRRACDDDMVDSPRSQRAVRYAVPPVALGWLTRQTDDGSREGSRDGETSDDESDRAMTLEEKKYLSLFGEHALV